MSNDNTSTPKRRRLGTGRILRPRRNLQVFDKDADMLNSSSSRSSSPYINDDLPLPCNQMEYLCESGSTSSPLSDIPCSLDIKSSSINTENWESLVVNKNHNNVNEVSSTSCKEIEDITDDMFTSKLEQESTQCSLEDTTLLTSRCEKHFKENIEESFNQSICDILNEGDNKDESALFETKDSFLLDIKESGTVTDDRDSNSKVFPKMETIDVQKTENDSFYGLPMIVKGLLKSYRNIEKLYDWQEECLNLDAVKERRNLVYALPTSGGKTLVADVLMLRELLNRKKNVLFILPFVAIVQEKMGALAPFALALGFLAEEYAGGRGELPPRRRRARRSAYVATIEKGLALVRSLVDAGRLQELGLVVVDELHLVGEPGRGATLEMLLATLLFADMDIQVVGMSATLGNVRELAGWLRAAAFEREFRPVALAEYVRLPGGGGGGGQLHRLRWGPRGQLSLEPARRLAYDPCALDPDGLGALVGEVVPRGACLVFCPTQRNAESVAALLARLQLQRREMMEHRCGERAALARALAAEGAGELARLARAGVAFHHAGLPAAERALLEHAYRAGVVSALCCTSTLAAGVNLPAARVVVRAPRLARAPLPLAAYRQMAGRAGRAGLAHAGECITICDEREWAAWRALLAAGLPPARSVLQAPPPPPPAPESAEGGEAGGEAGGEGEGEDSDGVAALVLSGVALRLGASRARLRRLLGCTLLAHAAPPAALHRLCDAALRALLRSGALAVAGAGAGAAGEGGSLSDDAELVVSPLGLAAIKGGMSVGAAARLAREAGGAARALVLVGALHLLWLVAPPPPAPLDYARYYSLYCNLDEEGVLTANALGITEVKAIRMMTGKPITGVSARSLGRFYVALLLRDVLRALPPPAAARKYGVSRGAVGALVGGAGAAARGAAAACEQLAPLRPFAALLAPLAARLRCAAAPHLADLMELPAVHEARAAALARAGYGSAGAVARAAPADLARAVPHLSRRAAALLVSAARMMLIEKVENLRAEAEDVMGDLQV